MKHTYKIEGMTCNNCKASVEKYLLELDSIITCINCDILCLEEEKL